MSGAAAPQGLFERLLGAYVDLRGSVRSLLRARPSEPTLLSFIMLAAFLSLASATVELSIESAAQAQTDPQAASEAFRSAFASQVYGAVLMFPLGLYLMSVVVTALARAAGGSGGFYEGRLALAWAALVGAPVVLLGRVVSALGENAGFGVVVADAAWLIVLALSAAGVYIVSACVAEAFGFPSTRRVLGGVAGGLLALTALGLAAQTALAAE